MTESRPVSKSTLTALYILIPLVIVGLTVGFIFWGRQKPPQMAMPPQPVVLETVAARDITDSAEYVAVMESDNIVELKARVSGFLVAKNFEDGDMVAKGQVLFQIEPDQYQALLDSAEASVLSAQAQLDRATLDFTRITDLYRKNTSPKSDYDSSKAAYEVAQAAVMSAEAARAQAKLNLDYASIKAPFDGRISDTPYYVGSLLGPESGVLATVVSVDPILATFGVSDRVITAARRDNISNPSTVNDWQVRLRIGPDHWYDQIGAFAYIAPMVDPQTDTVKFKAKFKNADKYLRPGQIVTAVVERVRPQRRIVAPKEAVLTDTDGNFVYVPKEVPADPKVPGSQAGLVADMRRVTISGGELEKDYIIDEGLQEGEKIIRQGLMSGGATLRPGAAIQIASPDGQGRAPGAGQAKDGQAQGPDQAEGDNKQARPEDDHNQAQPAAEDKK